MVSHSAVITEVESPNSKQNGKDVNKDKEKEVKQPEALPHEAEETDNFTQGAGWGGDYKLPDSSLQSLRR
jgi:hypothetical protein